MTRRISRSLALGAFTVLLGAGAASADTTFRIPMGPVDAGPQPVRMAAGDIVGRMIFSNHYRPTAEDALPGRVSIFKDDQILSLDDWLREWGAVQIREIGRPF